MTARQVAVLTSKVLGLITGLLFLQNTIFLVSLVESFFRTDFDRGSNVAWGIAAALADTALLWLTYSFWWGARSFAEGILKDSGTSGPPIDFPNLRKLVLQTLGAFFLVNGIAGFVNGVAEMAFFHHSFAVLRSYADWTSLIDPAVRLVAGAALCWASTGTSAKNPLQGLATKMWNLDADFQDDEPPKS